MDNPQCRFCSKCSTTKLLDAFGSDKSRPDGKDTQCLECRRKGSAAYRAKHPGKARIAVAAWRVANPGKVHAYAEAHREQKNARRRERYAEDPEAELSVNRAYYWLHKNELKPTRTIWEKAHRSERTAQKTARRQANPEIARMRDKAWYDANPEKVKAKNAASYAKYPESHIEKRQRRRAKKKSVTINDLSIGQIKEIKAAQNFCCAYCAKEFPEDALTIDHLTPLGPEGPNTLHNVIAACLSCNSKKKCGPVLAPVQPFLLTVATPRLLKSKKVS